MHRRLGGDAETKMYEHVDLLDFSLLYTLKSRLEHAYSLWYRGPDTSQACGAALASFPVRSTVPAVLG